MAAEHSTTAFVVPAVTLLAGVAFLWLWATLLHEAEHG